jgi:hypothetical protein
MGIGYSSSPMADRASVKWAKSVRFRSGRVPSFGSSTPDASIRPVARQFYAVDFGIHQATDAPPRRTQRSETGKCFRGILKPRQNDFDRHHRDHFSCAELVPRRRSIQMRHPRTAITPSRSSNSCVPQGGMAKAINHRLIVTLPRTARNSPPMLHRSAASTSPRGQATPVVPPIARHRIPDVDRGPI